MNRYILFSTLILSVLLGLTRPIHTATSSIVYSGDDGRLVYKPDARGNRIPDFSHAGYGGGGVEWPQALVVETLEPGFGGDGAAIQAAIDRVGHLPKNANGIRGAILLKRGTYQVEGELRIQTGAIILRGEGQGRGDTVIEATGTEKRTLLQIRSGGTLPAQPEIPGTRQNIVDAYVPVGANSFQIADASAYRVGTVIIVHRPSTQKWISALDMDQIPPRSDGGEIVQWASGKFDIRYNRAITAIDGNTITIDAPLFHALDQNYEQSSIYQYDSQYLLENIGIENLRAVSAYTSSEDESHAWTFISMNYVKNAWVQNVTAQHFGYSLISTSEQTKWITVKDCQVLDPISKITGSRRYSYKMEGQLHLVQDCYARNGRHDYVVGTYRSSGTVFLDCTSVRIHASNEPHHRYSTGILYDNVQHLNANTKLALGLWNRLNYGSGHGWSAANSVLWNCSAPNAGITCEKPPLAQNYAIGCNSASMSSAMRWGPFPGLKNNFVPGEAHWEHWNAGPVTPQSLYRAQLQDRQASPVPTIPPERVDFNTDGKVDFSDFLLFVRGFSNADLTYDLDEDSKVGFSDFLLFARVFQAAH